MKNKKLRVIRESEGADKNKTKPTVSLELKILIPQKNNRRLWKRSMKTIFGNYKNENFKLFRN